MEPASIYQQLGVLLANAPNLESVDDSHNIPAETIRWLGKTSALVEAVPGISIDDAQLNVSIQALIRNRGMGDSATQIMMILSRVLARVELASPANQQGIFISAGDGFDALAAIGKILSSAKSTVLIVDPYLDDTSLSDFAVLVNEGVEISLLTDSATIKPSLAPACTRWTAQYGDRRPLQARAALPKALHDRLILVDSDQAWILTQSLKDFAVRSPATIQRADSTITALKFEAYGEIWKASVPVGQ